MSQCRSCGASIRFERTARGKLTPINVKTNEPHWIDCPDRDEWRKTEKPIQTTFMDEEPPEPERSQPYYER